MLSGTEPPPVPDARHAPLEETLLGTSNERFVIARAEYASDAQESVQRPTALRVGIVDATTGDLKRLEDLLSVRPLDVPVSDGEWLAALDDQRAIWLVDLATAQSNHLASVAAPDQLLTIHYPWLATRTAGAISMLNVETQEQINLGDAAGITSLLIDSDFAAYLMPTDASGTADLRLLNLNSRATSALASLQDAQLLFYNGLLFWIVSDATGEAWLVNSFDTRTGQSSFVLRLKKVPLDRETQSILDRGGRGFLLALHSPNDAYNLTMEELQIYRTNGDRDRYVGYYALTPQDAKVIGQPRFAGEHVVFRDPNDGFWVVMYLDIAASRRVKVF